MTDLQTRCLDTFPNWLRTLGDDASALAAWMADETAPDAARRYIAGGLNYLFKSLDLIPDGIEDLGYLDDAFVLRVAAALAIAEAPAAKQTDAKGVLSRLEGEARLVTELLGDTAGAFETYVRSLTKGAARGRTVDEILGDRETLQGFVGEVAAWAKTYEAPVFSRDEKNLVKLKAFLAEKIR